MKFVEERYASHDWEEESSDRKKYSKKVKINRKDGEEFVYRIWLIEEEEKCKECGGLLFGYFAESWDIQSEWSPMSAYDDDYWCVNEKCEENELSPSEFEKRFIEIQQEAIDFNTPDPVPIMPAISGKIIKVGNSFAFGYIPAAIVDLHELDTKRLKAIFFEEI